MRALLNKPIFVLEGTPFTAFVILVKLLFPALLICTISVVIYVIIVYFLTKLYMRALDTGEITEEAQQRLHQAHAKRKKRAKRYIIFFTCVALFFVISSFISQYTNYNLADVFSVLSTPLYSSGKTSLSLVSILLIFVMGVLAYHIARTIRVTISAILKKMPLATYRKYIPFAHLAGYATLLLAFIIGLALIGIDISSLAVLFGVLGVGIGFGLQDIVSNFFSGLVISFSKIVMEGDRVVIRDVEGDVQKINLINTVVRSLTREELIIPNKYILNESIQNYSHSDRFVMAKAEVQVSYESDLHLVQKVITGIAEELPWRTKNSNVYFRVSSFDSSGITVKIYVCVDDVKDRYEAQSYMNMRIWERFKEEHIQIPYPQLDLHVKPVSGVKHIPKEVDLSTDLLATLPQKEEKKENGEEV